MCARNQLFFLTIKKANMPTFKGNVYIRYPAEYLYMKTDGSKTNALKIQSLEKTLS